MSYLHSRKPTDYFGDVSVNNGRVLKNYYQKKNNIFYVVGSLPFPPCMKNIRYLFEEAGKAQQTYNS